MLPGKFKIGHAHRNRRNRRERYRIASGPQCRLPLRSTITISCIIRSYSRSGQRRATSALCKERYAKCF